MESSGELLDEQKEFAVEALAILSSIPSDAPSAHTPAVVSRLAGGALTLGLVRLSIVLLHLEVRLRDLMVCRYAPESVVASLKVVDVEGVLEEFARDRKTRPDRSRDPTTRELELIRFITDRAVAMIEYCAFVATRLLTNLVALCGKEAADHSRMVVDASITTM